MLSSMTVGLDKHVGVPFFVAIDFDNGSMFDIVFLFTKHIENKR